MKKPKEKIPFHTYWGLRILQILIIILALFLMKRCAVLYHENKGTDQQVVIEYFERGFRDGMDKARGQTAAPEPSFKNYAFKKAYLDGFRKGWDNGRTFQEKQQ